MRLAHAVLVAAILTLLVLSTPLSVQQAPLSAYNDQGNGTGHLYQTERVDGAAPALTRDGEPVRLLHGRLAKLDPQRHALVIVDPQLAYTGSEAAHLRSFLETGGRALIAADTGPARSLIAELDANVTLGLASYYTPEYATDPRFPYAESTGAVEGLADRVVTRQPVLVEGGGQPVLTSPEPAWRDENLNARPDLAEDHGRFSIARLVPVGEGQLLVLGDPDLMTQAFAEQNPGAAQALVAWATSGQRALVVDEAHRAQADPVGVADLLAGEPPWRTAAVITASGLVLVVTMTVRPRLRRAHGDTQTPVRSTEGLEPAERAAIEELEAKHP